MFIRNLIWAPKSLQMVIAAKDGEAVYSQKKQDLELVLKKVGKTTKPVSYDLNQIYSGGDK